MNMISSFDNFTTQVFVSMTLGFVLGFIYQKVSPSTIVISSNDNTIIDELENKSFKDADKCYRYKKVETSCRN